MRAKIKFSKINEDSKRNIVFISIITAFVIFVLCCSFFYYKDYVEPRIGIRESVVKYSLGEKVVRMEKGDILQKEIYYPATEICGIGFAFSEEQVSDDMVLDVRILGESGEVLSQIQIEKDDIEEGFAEIVLENMVNLEHSGNIQIEIELIEGDYAEVIMNNNGTLAVSLVGKDVTNVLMKIVMLFCIAVLLLVGVAVYAYYKVDKIEKAFVMIGLVAGIIMMFLVPAYDTPDEEYHFVIPYAATSKVLGETVANDNGGTVVRKTDYDYYMRWVQGDSIILTKDSYIAEATSFSKTAEVDIQDNYSLRPIGGRTCFAYIPQIMGILIARILQFNGAQLFAMGRFMSLIAYLAIMYFAIKKIPFGKMALFVIGLYPMVLELASSYNYDALILPACFLGIAYILYLAYEAERIRKKDILVMCGIVIVIALVKAFYLVILMLALLIPKEKFGSSKRKYCMAGIMIGLGLCVMLYFNMYSVARLVPVSGQSVSTVVEERYTLTNILGDPFHTVGVWIRTFERNTSMYIGDAVGARMGWLNFGISSGLVSAFLIATGLGAMKTKTEKMYVTFSSKINAICCSGLILMAVYFSLHLESRKISLLIEGIQGRYFLPIFALVFLIVFRNQCITVSKEMKRYLIAGTAFLDVLAMMEILRGGLAV